MRLQLISAALVVTVAAPAAGQKAEPGSGNASGRLLVYSDDDATSVVTSVVDAEAELPAQVTVGAHALVDVISSASVDVVTAATGRWDENRVEVGGRVRGVLMETGLSVGAVRSQENDWRSSGLSVGVDRELFERNLRLSLSYALTRNDVGRAMDPTFERSVTSHGTEVSASQLIDDKTRVGGALTAQRLSGFLASPYRFVVALDGVRGPERHPDSRLRAALSGYALRSFGDLFAARASYRLYRDDWGIASHTVTASVRGEFFERVTAGIEGRFYWQNRADFYRPSYETNFRYMSSDRELATFWDAGGTADLAVRLGPITADAKLGVVHYDFANFPALEKRDALLAGGGVRAEW